MPWQSVVWWEEKGAWSGEAVGVFIGRDDGGTMRVRGLMKVNGEDRGMVVRRQKQ